MWQHSRNNETKASDILENLFFRLFFCVLPGSWRAEAALLTLTLEARGEIDHGRSASLFQSP